MALAEILDTLAISLHKRNYTTNSYIKPIEEGSCMYEYKILILGLKDTFVDKMKYNFENSNNNKKQSILMTYDL